MANAMYAGSFDPFTNGHLSIIKKAIDIHPQLKQWDSKQF